MGIIEDLRKKAELNFCERCFQEYKAMIEPTIQGLLLVPLADWRQIESEITQMVMKNEGIFKSKSIIISLGVDEKENSEVVDVQAFVKIKRWSFSHKIKYLHKNGSFKILLINFWIKQGKHGIVYMNCLGFLSKITLCSV